MVRRRKVRQGLLGLVVPLGHGGRRKGAGRRAVLVGGRQREKHGVRAAMNRDLPLHVSMRLLPGLPRLRDERTARLIRAVIRDRQKDDFGIVHFCILDNHLHLIVEGADRVAVSRGMQGFLSSLARHLNRLWSRSGKVFADRFHDEVLDCARRVRNALLYVLKNARRHGVMLVDRLIDRFSSEIYFAHFSFRSPSSRQHFRSTARLLARQRWDPTARPLTFLLREGWKRAGAIFSDALPAAAGRHDRPAPTAPRHSRHQIRQHRSTNACTSIRVVAPRWPAASAPRQTLLRHLGRR